MRTKQKDEFYGWRIPENAISDGTFFYEEYKPGELRASLLPYPMRVKQKKNKEYLETTKGKEVAPLLPEEEIAIVPSKIDGKKVTMIGPSQLMVMDIVVEPRDNHLNRVFIPDTVRIIGPSAFGNCFSLHEVILSNGLFEIERKAFSGCVSLEKITFPSTLRVIGADAFQGCSFSSFILPSSIVELKENPCSNQRHLVSLSVSKDNPRYYSPKGSNVILERETKKVISGCNRSILPKDTRFIGNKAFFGCSDLKEMDFPSSLEAIGENAFSFAGLKKAYLPDSLYEIGEGAFCDCEELKDVRLPSHLKEIPFGCLERTPLTKITFSESLKVIRFSAFSQCTSLTELTFPEGLFTIEDGAFYQCKGVKKIELPPTLTHIGNFAFKGLTSLAEITLPPHLKEIGEGVFSDCSSLKEVKIPKSVYFIGIGPFSHCPSLTSLKVEEGNPFYDSRENSNALFETQSNTLLQGTKKTIVPKSTKRIGALAFSGVEIEELSLPEEIEFIGRDAFEDCTKLKSLVLPNSIKEIERCAFENCTSLTSLSFPSSLKSLKSLFFKCDSLKEITLPEGLLSMDEDALDGCESLEKTTLPASLTFIGYESFSIYSKIKKIVLKGGVKQRKSLPFLEDYLKKHPETRLSIEE